MSDSGLPEIGLYRTQLLLTDVTAEEADITLAPNPIAERCKANVSNNVPAPKIATVLSFREGHH